ncbi:MAG: hypothetical protein KC486_29580, partial [Myxococcales bacterium]|nr:hypothetical protein [Myxococcales bacterium]
MRINTDRISSLGLLAPLTGRGGRPGTLALGALSAALCGCVITLDPGESDGDSSATEGSTTDDDTTAVSTATTTDDSDGAT